MSHHEFGSRTESVGSNTDQQSHSPPREVPLPPRTLKANDESYIPGVTWRQKGKLDAFLHLAKTINATTARLDREEKVSIQEDVQYGGKKDLHPVGRQTVSTLKQTATHMYDVYVKDNPAVKEIADARLVELQEERQKGMEPEKLEKIWGDWE